MLALLEIAFNVILPIFLIVGLSILVDRRFEIDPRTLSRLVIYLFAPFLVMQGIAESALEPAEMAQLAAMILLFSVVMALIGYGMARALRYDRRTESALMLTLVMLNAANYGIPLNRFAFGLEGEQRAVILYVVTAIVAYTFGVFLASRGSASVRDSLLNMFKVPLVYAAAVGLVLNFTGWRLPVPLERAVGLLADATVPAMLVVLGIQLSRVTLRGRLKPILIASAAKLLIAPLVAFALAALLGLEGLTGKVAIVEASMPTAVLAGVLATEFGSDAEFTTAVILVSTVGSIVTLSVILALLGVNPA